MIQYFSSCPWYGCYGQLIQELVPERLGIFSDMRHSLNNNGKDLQHNAVTPRIKIDYFNS